MRVGETIWHSRRKEIPNAEIAEFEAPYEIRTRFNYLTCMPATARGYLQIMQYGERIDNYWTIIANAKYFSGKIKEGDLMWVDGEKPIEHSISITLERNQNR